MVEFALRKRTVMATLVAVIVVVGVIAYDRLGRLENPDFVIKTAMVITRYPGASPEEVEEEVSDVLEEAIQSMGQLKEVRSMSQEGLSVIYAEMQDTYNAGDLPQIWDELRRKINDAQGSLPPGAGPSVVNDDFSDVYGLFYAISGEGCTYEELRQYAKALKTELLDCKDVAKIDFWGEQPEVIFIEIEHSRMAELGISPQQIVGVLQSQNVVEPSGKVKVGDEYIRITPTGDFSSETAHREPSHQRCAGGRRHSLKRRRQGPARLPRSPRKRSCVATGNRPSAWVFQPFSAGTPSSWAKTSNGG